MTAGAIEVIQGEMKQTTITLTSVGGFNESMNVGYAYLGNGPAGTAVDINPAAVIPTATGSTTILSFTAGATTAAGSYTIRAIVSGGGLTATTDIPVTVAVPLTLVTNQAISGNKDQALSPITANGGLGTALFTISKGTLPTGVTFNPDGTFGGKPTARGTYTFTVQVADAEGHTVNRDYTVRIHDPAFRAFVMNSSSWTVEKSILPNQINLSPVITISAVDDYGNPVDLPTSQIQILSSAHTGRHSTDGGASLSIANISRPALTAGTRVLQFPMRIRLSALPHSLFRA